MVILETATRQRERLITERRSKVRHVNKTGHFVSGRFRTANEKQCIRFSYTNFFQGNLA